MRLDESEKRLVGRLLAATVDEFYPTRWFDWDEVAALRDRLSAEGVTFERTQTSFDGAYPLPGKDES